MKGIVAVVTYNCNITCSNCSYSCGPHRKGVMFPQYFKQRVLEAYEDGYMDYLEIAGGEPLLHTGMIFKYLKNIKDIEIRKQTVTNGFWGKNDYFIDILAALKKWGICEIILEYDSFHSVFIEQETILEAIKKCHLCGIKVRLRATFETSSLNTDYDLKTLKIIKEMRENNNKVIFEYRVLEKYMGMYKRDEYINTRVIIPDNKIGLL